MLEQRLVELKGLAEPRLLDEARQIGLLMPQEPYVFVNLDNHVILEWRQPDCACKVTLTGESYRLLITWYGDPVQCFRLEPSSLEKLMGTLVNVLLVRCESCDPGHRRLFGG